MSDLNVEHQVVRSGEVGLHVVLSGPLDGAPVILLHGFPEYWYGWREQIPALAEAGYRVWAPDQRGYNLSDKPRGVAAYGLDVLAGDVVALVRATRQGRAILVGHDWGGVVAWWTATRYPDLVERMVILDAPHPAIVWSTMARHPDQMLRSAYVGLFQVPWLPERLLAVGGWRALERVMTATARPGTFSEDDLTRYRAAWSQPGALRCMLDWYRALVRARPTLVARPRVTVPTLILWGERDLVLGTALARDSLELCDDGELVVLEQAGHWLQHEDPDEVNEQLLSFLHLREEPERTAPSAFSS